MRKAKHIPLRTCAACGQKLPKGELIRVVRTQVGNVEVDPSGKVDGRGAYLCPTAACWERAFQKGRLEHVLRSSLQEQDREALNAYYQGRLTPTGIGGAR